jgi:hypothetical protein
MTEKDQKRKLARRLGMIGFSTSTTTGKFYVKRYRHAGRSTKLLTESIGIESLE